LGRTQTKPPNIIVFLVDDLGFNDISWHNDKVLTPHLDELARSGIILEQHYSQAVCSPTRGALLTGRYPINIGLQNGAYFPLTPTGLDTQFNLLPQELKRAGYVSHIVGKWHLGLCNKKYWPHNRGFDSYNGMLQGGGTYTNHSLQGGYDYRDNNEVDWDADGIYSTFRIQERTQKIINEHDSSSPMFLYVPFQAVHFPNEVPDVYKDMYSHVESEERRTFLGMVTAMDDAVGNITQTLKDSGLYDNSIIIWFSDNGGPSANWPRPGAGYESFAANNYPLRGAKMTLWEGGTKTPAMIHSPSYLPRGEVSDLWLHVTDWYPTILSMAGLSSTETDLDGINHWSQLQDLTLSGDRTEMIYNIFYPQFTFWDHSPIAAIRKGDWKYIKRTFGFGGWTSCPPEQCVNATADTDGIEDARDLLFNIANDPSERKNLIEFEPSKAEELRIALDGHIANVDPEDLYPAQDHAGDPENFGGLWSDGWC